MGCQSPDSQASEIVVRSAMRFTLQRPYSGTAQWWAVKMTDGVKNLVPVDDARRPSQPQAPVAIRQYGIDGGDGDSIILSETFDPVVGK